MPATPTTPPPLLKYMRLVLCGALQLLEPTATISASFSKKKLDSLIRALDAVEMGVFWVGTQIDDMIARQDIKEMV